MFYHQEKDTIMTGLVTKDEYIKGWRKHILELNTVAHDADDIETGILIQKNMIDLLKLVAKVAGISNSSAPNSHRPTDLFRATK